MVARLVVMFSDGKPMGTAARADEARAVVDETSRAIRTFFQESEVESRIYDGSMTALAVSFSRRVFEAEGLVRVSFELRTLRDAVPPNEVAAHVRLIDEVTSWEPALPSARWLVRTRIS